MSKDHGPQIKDGARYEALRDKGLSKEAAARIANASADPEREPEKKGGEARPYQDWTVAELRKRAAEIGIDGRSKLNKAGLIEALRTH